ncbi:MAG: ferredoxin-thioredoxin reductase catalytic domain-containing protein [Anaerolineae bacterium]|nr:ferredoxin:glutaredoxin reductase [Anaerolineae bacterium]MDW8102708.1 ferredoxin-thioredoxin reductase catalytic domain-containing protein [Anaerolineae bacterium]
MVSERSQEALELYERLRREAESSGYYLNPDLELVLDLMEGLVTNLKRYGYMACPCRLASGVREKDLDIICPCDYRDADLEEYGACYCGLYVSEEVAQGRKKASPVPERRGTVLLKAEEEKPVFSGKGMPVWRCKVCGYLCARPSPPLKCPICKADKDRFERFA